MTLWLWLPCLSGCPNGVRIALDLINEARRLTADASAQLDRAAEASQRAVMVEDKQAAEAAGGEAERARKLLETDLDQIQALLTELDYQDELALLRQARDAVQTDQALEQNILLLARQKSNRQATALAFGPVAEAADAFRRALADLAATAKGKTAVAFQLQCASASLGVREVQVLHAPHIAEPDDEAMTALEQRMELALSDTQRTMAALSVNPTPEAKVPLDAANAALARFLELHKDLLALSRRNTDVQAQALSLEQKRAAQTRCQEVFTALGDALAQRTRPGTR